LGKKIVIASLREFVNRALGRGEATITVPSTAR
jgi:hypothetical protein